MVCDRCILVVKQELDKLQLTQVAITLGEVEIADEVTHEQLKQLKNNLASVGFEVLDDGKKKLIEKIKTIIIEQIHYLDADDKHNFSEILSQKLHKDYSYLSALFSEVESITIEKYIINQKTEKVKELLVYDELNLSEIAYKLGYSSVAHLSAQFKKTTGLTPSHFKKLGGIHRKPLDKV
ncbi:MAG: AraC family transcriptional regulator [Bacteroidota bacterium]|nr:AraC family transcriptional regulator [Bacteroidota bacterium]